MQEYACWCRKLRSCLAFVCVDMANKCSCIKVVVCFHIDDVFDRFTLLDCFCEFH